MPVPSIAVWKSHNPRRPGTPAWRSCAALFGLALGVARRVFRRLIGRHPVALLEPAAEIDIGAALRAEGLMPRDRGLVADWAAALAGGKGCDGVLRHHFRYRLTAARCQKGSGRGSARRQWRSPARAALRGRAMPPLPRRAARPRSLD